MTSRFGFHPVALGVRFILELMALVCFGIWAWHVSPAALRYVAAVAVPLAVAALWGVFATPGDASRSGETVIATPGPLRFLLELAVFFGGAAALYAAGVRVPAAVLAGVLVVYHVLSWDRVLWLLKH
ncbi:membrane protein [Streptomyces sp. NRRL WC-3618]|uniref:YrdB family protein n=1 Tax=Streptomyces sp. NRRL WC-3618 TaxID=1519490 RepID=UPI0006ADD684|nr:YrdB family protein [Streptomyces sp. NRRL WC-3618]KOV61783.1 membrane protein [Streptomyces sp. NRRL WC-3618]